METERQQILSRVRDLESRNNELVEENKLLGEQVEKQGAETFEIAGAVMEIRQEDSERLAAFRKQNTELVQFVELIADSKSKFATEARRILGF